MSDRPLAWRFSKRALADKCALLEKYVLRNGYATEPELAGYRPGRANGKTLGAWVVWHAQLTRFCGREELSEQREEGADLVVLDALRDEPAAVTIGVADERGIPRTVLVHPKSLDALVACHARDWVLGWMAVHIDSLRRSSDPRHADLISRAMFELSYHYRVLAWIVTHEGAGVPFGWDEDRPDAPADSWLHRAGPQDFILIARAFAVVNAQRLNALSSAMATSTGTDEETPARPSWSTFLGSLSMRLETFPIRLARDTSLISLLSMVETHSAAEAEAMKKARDEQPTGSGQR